MTENAIPSPPSGDAEPEQTPGAAPLNPPDPAVVAPERSLAPAPVRDLILTSTPVPAEMEPSALCVPLTGQAREETLAHRVRAEAAFHKSNEDFDKLVVTVSSGALALSVGFADKIVPLSTATCRGFVVASWISFAVSLLVSIRSHRIAAKAHDFVLEQFNNRLEGKPVVADIRWAPSASRLNGWSEVLTGVGIGLFIIFACINLVWIPGSPSTTPEAAKDPVKLSVVCDYPPRRAEFTEARPKSATVAITGKEILDMTKPPKQGGAPVPKPAGRRKEGGTIPPRIPPPPPSPPQDSPPPKKK